MAHYKGEILLHRRLPVIDNTCPQLIEMSFPVSLNISNALVDMYMKVHKNREFDDPMCTHVFKCF